MIRRKRAVSDLLSDNEESTTTRSSRKSRAVSRILNEESDEESTSTTPTHGRRMEICNCSKCRGKLVDARTKIIHNVEDDQDSPQENTNPLPSLEDTFSENLEDDDEPAIRQMEVEETEDLPDNLTRRRPKRYINRQTTARLPEFFTTDEELSTIHSESEDDGGNNNNNSRSEIYEDYSPPNYEEQFQEQINPERSANPQFSWILLWIMSFRRRFNIPETATESLIQFVKLLLKEIGGSNFDEFPGTLYLTRKFLGLEHQHHSFVPCPNCHKLYNKKDVKEFYHNKDPVVMKCNHVKFPNLMTRKLRQC
jgi:hypothetical protein